MTEKLKQTIKEEIAKLPKENQEAINSLDWGSMSEEIGKKYLLSESEINDLQVETLLVLTGLEYLELYADNIEENTGISKDEADKIAEEIFKKIFTPINDILIENIKGSGKVKNANAEQALNFILSGGDYSSFVEVPPPLSGEDRGEVFEPSSLDKGRLGGVAFNSPHPNPLLKGEGDKSRKMDDIKSKFTI